MASMHGKIVKFLMMLFPGCLVTGLAYPPAISDPPAAAVSRFFVVVPTKDNLVLTCQPDITDGSAVVWRRNKTTPLPSGWRPAPFTGSDYDIPPTAPFVANSIVLSSNRISEKPDAFGGAYECVVNNSAGVVVSGPVTVMFSEIRVGNTAVANIMEPTVVRVNAGSSLNLQCSSKANQPLSFRPSIVDTKFSVLWILEPGRSTGVVGVADNPLSNKVDKRYAYDESGNLYIRRFTQRDATTDNAMVACKLQGPLVPTGGLVVGRYQLTAQFPVQNVTTAKLLHKTSDVTAKVGASFYLSCIFEDGTDTISDVEWTGPSRLNPSDMGTLLEVSNAQLSDAGEYKCRHVTSGLTETIKVAVLNYPVLVSPTDMFPFVGDVVTFTCTLANPLSSVTYQWFYNDDFVDTTSSRIRVNANSLVINNVVRSDTGVVGCSATHPVSGTMKKSARLIVTGRPVVTMYVSGVNASAAGGPAEFPITNTTTGPMKFICNYTLDAGISGAHVEWGMERLLEKDPKVVIMEGMKDQPAFGLTSSSVINSALVSTLTIAYRPDRQANYIGYVNCTLVYNVLNSEFRIPCENRGRIFSESPVQKPIIVTPGEFPYWIIGVIVAALFLILLVFLIIFCVQRNKGEQYYVDEKERKAGHDPKEELPPWQEFNRPDQDPVKGSRASLEMEGERPMGSDTGSMDEYGVDTDTGKFNEDGSFIGQYGQKGRPGASGHN